MPRNIEVSLSPDHTPAAIEGVRQLSGVIGLSVQRGASLKPPGDVLSIQTTNGGSRAVLALLEDLGALEGGSVQLSELSAVVSPSHQERLGREENETNAPELSFLLGDFANPTLNYLLLMALSGALAGVGFWQGQLIYILAGQLLGPHVEPLLRVPSGLLNGPRAATRQGALAVVGGYLCMALGGAAIFWLLHWLDPGVSMNLDDRMLGRSFSQLTSASAVGEGLAAIAAGLIVTSRRTPLLGGVYIALALAPSMTLIGIGLSTGQWAAARGAAVRWTFDALAVMVLGGLVLALKQGLVYRRRMAG